MSGMSRERKPVATNAETKVASMNRRQAIAAKAKAALPSKEKDKPGFVEMLAGAVQKAVTGERTDTDTEETSGNAAAIRQMGDAGVSIVETYKEKHKKSGGSSSSNR